MLSATVYRAGAPLQQQRRTPATSATARRAAVQTQALFGFLSPAKSVKGGPSKAQALVDQLLELTERTEGGLNASPSRRQEIEELVGELEAYCPRNPLRSPLLFGDYEVLYASKPQTAGGPYRSPIGRVIFPGQRALQSLQEPNILVNEVCGWVCGCAGDAGELLSGQPWCLLCLPFISLHRGCLHGCCCLLHCYHTLPPTHPPTHSPTYHPAQVTYQALGIVPGSARQEGEFSPLSSNTFKVRRGRPQEAGRKPPTCAQSAP